MLQKRDQNIIWRVSYEHLTAENIIGLELNFNNYVYFISNNLLIKLFFKFKFLVLLKRSGDPGPTPEGGGTTPEGSLTLVSILLLLVFNVGLDILGDLSKLNITKYLA